VSITLVSIDAGKYLTKAVITEGGKFKTFSLRTKLEEYSEVVFKDTNTYEINYGGKSYLIGNNALHSDYDSTKTKLVHQLAIYTMLGLVANRCEVDLVTGCPLSQYLSTANKNAYGDFILGKKYIQIKINGVDKNFTINKVSVYPESIGVLILNIADCAKKIVGVIDIGGLNTNGAIYDDLNPVESSMFTVNEGGNILFSKIKRELNIVTGRNYQDYEIPYVIREHETKHIIANLLKHQLQIIIEECKRYNWNVEAIPLLFTGGGSLLLEKQIKELPNATLSGNAVFDNAMGFYKLKELL
jgi:plasmid segregation protein ParM